MAANVTARQVISLRDAKGQIARMSFFIRYDAAEAAPDAAAVGSAISAAVVQASNAAFAGAYGPYSQLVPSTYGARADYVDAEDKAVLTYQAADGTLHHFSIPAPKAALFMADGQTVSPTSAVLTAFTAGVVATSGAAFTSTRGGSAFTLPAFIGGQRQRLRTQRKMTIWTLSGGLDEPAV